MDPVARYLHDLGALAPGALVPFPYDGIDGALEGDGWTDSAVVRAMGEGTDFTPSDSDLQFAQGPDWTLPVRYVGRAVCTWRFGARSEPWAVYFVRQGDRCYGIYAGFPHPGRAYLPIAPLPAGALGVVVDPRDPGRAVALVRVPARPADAQTGEPAYSALDVWGYDLVGGWTRIDHADAPLSASDSAPADYSVALLALLQRAFVEGYC